METTKVYDRYVSMLTKTEGKPYGINPPVVFAIATKIVNSFADIFGITTDDEAFVRLIIEVAAMAAQEEKVYSSSWETFEENYKRASDIVSPLLTKVSIAIEIEDLEAEVKTSALECEFEDDGDDESSPWYGYKISYGMHESPLDAIPAEEIRWENGKLIY